MILSLLTVTLVLTALTTIAFRTPARVKVTQSKRG